MSSASEGTLVGHIPSLVPLADRFIGHANPTSEQEFPHVAVAEIKAAGQPDTQVEVGESCQWGLRYS